MYKKGTVTSGWSTTELIVTAALVLPWAANYLGVDLATVAIVCGFMPTDAEQVKLLADQIQASRAANSPMPPLVGLAYVIGRPWLKAHGVSLDILKAKKEVES